MADEHLKMVMAVIMTAVLASTGTYVALSGGNDETHETFTSDFPTLELGNYVAASLYDSTSPDPGSELRSFGTFGELKTFLGKHARTANHYYYGGEVDMAMSEGAGMDAGAGSAATSYTNTNIQVAGVDEGDIVKTDGEYAYIVSGSGQSVFIVRAYPAEDAEIMCEIESAGTFIDLYLEGNNLILLEQVYYFEGGFSASNYRYSEAPMVNIKMYDVTNMSSPALANEAVLGGNYLTSRMMDGKLYAMGNQYIQDWNNESQLPVPLDSLYYTESGEENAYSITSFLVLDITDPDSVPSILGIIMDTSNNIFVSENNIYLTGTAYEEQGSLLYEDYYTEKTVIHRIGIQGQDLKYRARGEVPGRVLNRYSMDEFEGHFRIATTEGWSWGAADSRNMVHVLDMALDQTGVLDNIAPGEQIYSARFMGQRLYLVTFRQVDPFYVIDLHDAENPKILGELKIPGYSSYLHPYDENHIIGLGQDGSTLKIALFNVSDVENPTELDSWAFNDGNGYSYSSALTDPHAFTFCREKNLLVIPITGHSYDYYNSQSVSGAYVFGISPEDGIILKGSIEHESREVSEYGYYDYYYYTYSQVQRSFIIGDVLYTVSGTMMKANAINGLSELAAVELD